MRTSVKKNYIYNLVYQILILITPLVTTPYVSRVLGENGIGAVSYTQSIVIYFILFGTVGTTMYGQREIAYIQDDKKKQSQLFFEITIFRTLTVTTSLIIFFLTFARKGDYALLY
ncbi:MAG: oligosaccharide flippase family protein, partial [Lachnospiraceae bacterium]